MVKIGNVEIERYAALAPMASVSDYAFRAVCKDLGASYLVGEMASAKGLCYGDKKTERYLKTADEERPMAVQLFGCEPDFMARAAELCMPFKPDIIDINMGCPVPKIVSQGSGSALMKNPDLAGRIIAAVVNAADIPVTVKLRAGFANGEENAVELARIAEDCGAKAVTIHCRTREQMYSFPVNWEIIANVKKAVKIPVIGNGGIRTAEDAVRMYEETGCDLVMVGEGALYNPFIFREIKALIDTVKTIPPATMRERMDNLIKQAKISMELNGEAVAMKEMRKHAAWQIKGTYGSAALRAKAVKIGTFRELRDFTKEAARL